MTDKFFITNRDGGLGDTLLNLHATHFFAKKFNGSVVVDWRSLPYNIFSKNKINLFHSLFELPSEIDGVKYYSYEEIEECHDYELTRQYPFILPGPSREELDKIILENKYLNVRSRSCEGTNNYFEIQGVEILFEYIEYLRYFKLNDLIQDKINYYKNKYFKDDNVVTIHVRHGNGEERGGYNGPWCSYETIERKIYDILKLECSDKIDNKKFLICTDNKKLHDDFLTNFPNSFSIEKTYSDDNIGALHKTSNNPIQTIHEAFIEMELLSYGMFGIFTYLSVYNTLPTMKMIYEKNRNVYHFDRDSFFKYRKI
jgi:hypothetical protein